MKTRNLFTVIMVLFFLGISPSLSLMTIVNAQEDQNQPQVSEIDSETIVITGNQRPLIKDRKKSDLKSFYESRLKEYDINDFSSDSLIKLMDNEISTIRLLAAMYLGEKKERLAIPKLEEALDDESFPLMRAAAKALFKMENKKGIEKLKQFCEKVYKEIGNGNLYSGTRHPNNQLLLEQAQAFTILADAGEVSTIKYIRTLLENKGLRSTKIICLRALIKLYEKDKSVLKDITSMLEDDNPLVKKTASEFLEKIKKEK